MSDQDPSIRHDLTVIHVPIEDVMPYATNAKQHPLWKIAELAAGIKKFGWTSPCFIDEDGTLIAGHGRVQAALKLDMKTVPCIRLVGLSDVEKKSIRLFDNRVSEKGGWDMEMLKLELGELASMGVDLSGIGWSAKDLDELDLDASGAPAGNPGQTDPDAVPEKAPARAKRGDVWVCGEHKIMCGDSTNAEDVARLMAGEKAALCFTSPPYAQQRDYGVGKVTDWDALMDGVFLACPLIEDGQLLVNLGLVHRESEWLPYWDGWIESMRMGGWRRFGLYVWDQGPGLPGDWNGRLAPAFELIFHFNRASRKANKTKECKHAGAQNHGTGLRGADGIVSGYTAINDVVQPTKIGDSVVRIMRHKARGIECRHPAVFPVDLSIEIMGAYSARGEAVYEPFCGSGSTLIACEKTGRRCFGMEISPEYCDIIIERFEKFSGKTAHLANGKAPAT